MQGRASTGEMNVNTQGTPSFEVVSSGTGASGNAAYMTFHRPSAFAVRLGLGTDNLMRVGGWSLGNLSYRVLLGDGFSNAGNVTITGTITSTLSGNASTATTLETIRTIWGQNFDGSGNVIGNLTSVGNITGSGAITITAGGTNQNITLTPSGTGTVNSPTFNATSTTSGGFQGIDADSATAPSFTWSGNLNTGIYRSGANEVAVTTNGSQAAFWDANGNYRVIGSIGLGASAISNANIMLNASNTFTQNGSRRGVALTLNTSDQELNANREQIAGLFAASSTQSTLFDSVNSVNRVLTIRGLYGQAFNGGANDSNSVATSVIGVLGLARNRGRQTVPNVYGLQSIVDNAGPLEVPNGVPQINNARGSDIVVRIRTGTTENAYGTYNYVRSGGISSDNGTITNGFGTYALMQNSQGTYTRAFGSRVDFSGTIGQKIGFLTIGGADLDFGAQSTTNITIGHWNTNGTATTRLTIDTSGNTTLGGSLSIGGNLTVPNTQASNFWIRNTAPTIHLRDTDHNTSFIHCNSNIFYILRGATDATTWTQVNGVWPLQINLTNNNATFGGTVTASSDVRFKKNVHTIENALNKTLNLRGVTFEKIDTEGTHIGVIAQEVEEVVPEVVFEDDEGKKSVAYGNLVGLLIEAIKELKNEVDELKKSINN
jgi:hypothetical protein